MALQPNLLSGLDRAIALAWSKAQCRVRNVSRVCFDYETYYSNAHRAGAEKQYGRENPQNGAEKGIDGGKGEKPN